MRRKGFTILELLVVVAILAIIAIIVIPQFIGAVDRSKVSQELAEVNSVTKAAHMYYMDHSCYPTLQGDQPTFGDPKNLKFKGDVNGDGLYPEYLASLPHFSYWYIDNNGKVYHVPESIEDSNSDTPALNPNLQYENHNDSNGVYEIPFISKVDGNKLVYPAVILGNFEGTKMNPEAPGFNTIPVAKITMDPKTGLNTTTSITWSYDGSTDADNDAIVASQWQLDNGEILDSVPSGAITTAGNHEMKLRVQDSKGAWSKWVSSGTFSVTEAIVNLTKASAVDTFMAGLPYPCYNATVQKYGDKVYVFYGDCLGYYPYCTYRISYTIRNADGTELVAPKVLVDNIYINSFSKVFDAKISKSGDIYISYNVYKNSAKMAQIGKYDSDLNLVKTFDTGVACNQSYYGCMNLALDDNNIYMVGANYVSYSNYRYIYKYDYNFNTIASTRYSGSPSTVADSVYIDNGVLYVDELMSSVQNSGDYLNAIYTYNTSDLLPKSFSYVHDQHYGMTYGNFVKAKNGSLWYLGGDSPDRYTALTPKAFKIDTSDTSVLTFSSYIQLTSPGLSQYSAIPLDDGRVEIFYNDGSANIKHLYLE